MNPNGSENPVVSFGHFHGQTAGFHIDARNEDAVKPGFPGARQNLFKILLKCRFKVQVAMSVTQPDQSG